MGLGFGGGGERLEGLERACVEILVAYFDHLCRSVNVCVLEGRGWCVDIVCEFL